jgi:hypothetical protein
MSEQPSVAVGDPAFGGADAAAAVENDALGSDQACQA